MVWITLVALLFFRTKLKTPTCQSIQTDTTHLEPMNVKMDDNGRAASGTSVSQTSGVATARKRVPTACPPAAKQKASKPPQPANKLPNKKQPAAPAAGFPSAPSGASKTLGDGSARKANVQQPKQPASKTSSVDNLSARATVKKAPGERASGPKTSGKTATEKEVQQKPPKVTTQPTGMLLPVFQHAWSN